MLLFGLMILKSNPFITQVTTVNVCRPISLDYSLALHLYNLAD